MNSDTPYTHSLPPISPRICSCDVHHGKIVDRKIQEIERLILVESKVLDTNCPGYEKDRFSVYRKGFEMLIEESASFKQLLSNINNEYLEVIATVEKGEIQKSSMLREVKGAVSQQATLINYKKRIKNLQEKADRIQSNNNDLRITIEKLKNENKEIKNEASEKSLSEKWLKLDSSCALPGLKLEEQTDIELLSNNLERLKSEVTNMHNSFDDKFREKDQKVLLQEQLSQREKIHENLVKHNSDLKKKLEKLNIAVQAAKLTSKTKGKKKDVCDVVLKALDHIEQLQEDKDPLQFLISADEDDPLKKKESEQLIIYVEFFNNLFDFGQYGAAAIHAASSPKGILRTRQALQKFKEIESYDGPKSPLFLFCEALITTSCDKSDNALLQLTARMSVECIECALKEGNVDLALHWLNQPCVTWSVNLADLLSASCKCCGKCICGCHAVAQGIYHKFGKHKQVCLALTRQEKYQAFLDYGQTCSSFTPSDYQVVLEANPSTSLAKTLLLANINDRNMNNGLSYCSIVRIFLDNNELDLLIQFLTDIENNGIYDKKYLKYSIKDLIFLEKTSDKMNDKKWGEVIDLCHGNGQINLAVEILSTLVVRQAINHAAILSSLDYIS